MNCDIASFISHICMMNCDIASFYDTGVYLCCRAEPGSMGRRVLSEYDLNSRVPSISYVNLRNVSL